jgi:hypothetical protein
MRLVFLNLAKFFLRLAVDKALEKALPKIYKELDTDLPPLFYHQAPKEIISFEISKAIVRNMNGIEAKPVTEIVKMLYDPAMVNQHKSKK